MKRLLLMAPLFLLGLLPHLAGGQTKNTPLETTVRGKVTDAQSGAPLPGVNVYTKVAGEKQGTVTGPKGYYELKNVPVGRRSFYFSHLGYEPLRIPQQELVASKDKVLNATLQEASQELATVEVVAAQKSRTKNERVNISGRTFSIEESQRFAGANQDVARMASNFAGVQRSNDATNDIVIRGNSPNGLIWRLEDVPIPNPNHFGGFGATGGPVSVLNNNVLANSDFLTSAFPADYGNGLAGVFDLQLRNGNNEEHEFLGQVGFNGFEAGAEGPINREQKASYLVNYRYSTLDVLQKLGINFGTGTAVPRYQDLNFKLHLPTENGGLWEVFGLGGISAIDFLDSENEPGQSGGFYSDDEDLRNRVKRGVAGVSHQYFFDQETYSKVIFSADGTENAATIDTVPPAQEAPVPQYRQEYRRHHLRLHALVNHKIDARQVLRGGFHLARAGIRLSDSIIYPGWGRFRVITDEQGAEWRLRPYLNWQYHLDETLELNAGLHSLFTEYDQRLEPRLGLTYHLSPKSSLNAGYGLHSQTPAVAQRYRQERLPGGGVQRPNLQTETVKSQHAVLGYRQEFPHDWHLRVEAYYQDLYDALVEPRPSSYSGLNRGSFDFAYPDSVVNRGRGRNYGLDLTLEKFMDKGFYMLTTVSVFNSRYRGSDGQWRSTAFNSQVVANWVGGKEWLLLEKGGAKPSRHILTVDGKLSYAGGQPYTPIDPAASQRANSTVYDQEAAYNQRFKDYFRADLRLGYKIAGAKVTQEWALDVQNLTDRANPFGRRFDAETATVSTINQLGFYPMFLYRITF